MSEQTLFPIPPVTHPRPRPKDEDAYPVAALAVARALMRYAGHGLGDDEQSVADDIAKAMKYSYGLDGFKIGKELEDSCYWEVDAGMIDDLDCCRNEVQEEIKRLTIEWVKDNEVRPLFAVGDMVSARVGLTWKDGVIRRIEPDATYYVHTEDQPETSSYIINWENVRARDAEGRSEATGSLAEGQERNPGSSPVVS